MSAKSVFTHNSDLVSPQLESETLTTWKNEREKRKIAATLNPRWLLALIKISRKMSFFSPATADERYRRALISRNCSPLDSNLNRYRFCNEHFHASFFFSCSFFFVLRAPPTIVLDVYRHCQQSPGLSRILNFIK